MIGKLKLEHLLEDWVRLIHLGQDAQQREEELDWSGRIEYGLAAVRDIVSKND